ncbi:hypothetical protein TWF694_005063 [Orbilia ellipsospora]|uniref:Solute carrier family 40 member n=1 Tax=Orbilia ellipsospora TaxID=2528407 RepID=A0AAV9X0K2_9PEZI
MSTRRDSGSLVDEEAPLLPSAPGITNTYGGAESPGEGEDNNGENENLVSTSVARRLYISHFLSTWNSRVFEFGAVLYLADIYPNTLLPMSVYAFTRGLAAILFAPLVGWYIDNNDRLKVVRLSIVSQRLVVAASCGIFYYLMVVPYYSSDLSKSLLAVLAFLACIEKLGSIMNLVSVEKDWIVVIAGRDQASLNVLNAQMRRIDLICKLVGPLFIALLAGVSTEIAILTNLTMNIVSVAVEYFAIARVYHDDEALQQPKALPRDPNRQRPIGLKNKFVHNWEHVKSGSKKFNKDFGMYFRHRAFLPSFAGALLYLTVLSFAGQMVTYLLAAGYSSTQVGITRTFSVIFEILATWFAPWLMGLIGPIRAGIWLASWQATSLVAGLFLFWRFADRPFVSASGLVGGTIFSRVGLRGFDLCTQVIVQEDVEPEVRGTFSSIEAAWQNAFEIMSYLSTIIFFRPEQFRWPASLSVGAVVSASILYASFVYIRRGHLLHLEKLPLVFKSRRRQEISQEQGIERLLASNDV